MTTHKKDCLKCNVKESVLITIGDPTENGIPIEVTKCSNCGHQSDLEDYLPPNNKITEA